MNLRKITSITALVSFGIESFTSVILYIVPHGRIAYWADWRFWGLSKTQWSNLHITLGILFLLSLILHTVYNWTMITAYLKNKSKQVSLVNQNLITAAILTIVVSLGTLYEIPPFSTVLNFSTTLKDNATKIYGEPPYGHAELSSLKVFAGKLQLDINESLLKLSDKGIQVESPEQTLADVAQKNKITPKDIYQIIKPAPGATKNLSLPEEPPPGSGNKTVGEISKLYNLNPKTVVRILERHGFSASQEMTLKEIGRNQQRNPHDIYQYIYQEMAGTHSQ